MRSRKYRPFIVTSGLSKLVEINIEYSVIKHMQKSVLLKSNQHGFFTFQN